MVKYAINNRHFCSLVLSLFFVLIFEMQKPVDYSIESFLILKLLNL